MTKIDPSVERTWLEQGAIIQYVAESVSPSTIMAWSADVLKMLVKQEDKHVVRLLYNVSAPRASLAYLVLTNRDILHPGITLTGKMHVERVLKQNPQLHIYFALVLSQSASGKLAQQYDQSKSTSLNQVTGQIFFDETAAINWLEGKGYEQSTMTRPLDQSKLLNLGSLLENEERDVEFGDRDSIAFMIDGDVRKINFRASRSIIIGRDVIMENNTSVDLDLNRYKTASSISRQHARIKLSDGKLYIVDLNSTNGTRVDGKLITPGVPHIIRKFDMIQIGQLSLSIIF